MRITFLIANTEGGAGGDKVIAEHARFLLDQGHDVTLVGTPPRRPRVTDILRAIRRGNSAPLAKRLFPGNPRLGEHFAASDLSVCRLSSFRPITDADVPDADIVIGTWWETAEWMLNLSPEKGVKVHFVQGDDSKSQPNPDRVLEVFRASCPKIAVSKFAAELLKELGTTESVWIVENSVDLDRFFCSKEKNSSSLTLGFVVTSAPVKRVKLAVEAAEALRSRIPNLRVHTFGEPKYSEDQLIPSWFDHRIRPPQSEIPSLYRSCDIWLWTSETEGFGLPILEALASGVPVVATRAGAAPDLITPDCGVLVPGNVEAIVDAVCNLAENPAKLLEMKLAARARAVEVCTPPSGVAFERALKEILSVQKDSAAMAAQPKELSA
jgi:glycosyltransferase involved in cell wall biosynthesis